MSDADKENNIDLLAASASESESHPDSMELPGDEAGANKRVKKNGFMELLGSGPGRFYLVSFSVISLAFVAFGAVSLISDDDDMVVTEMPQVQSPRVPHDAKKATSISEQEARNRKLRAQQEADAAYQQGDTYLPPIDDIAVNATASELDNQQEDAINSVFGDKSDPVLDDQVQQLLAKSRGEPVTESRPSAATAPSTVETTETTHANNEADFYHSTSTMQQPAFMPTANVNNSSSNQRQHNVNQANYASGQTPEQKKAEQQRIAKELQAAKKMRDAYVKSVNKQIMSQVGMVMGDKSAISLSSTGSTVTYFTPSAQSIANGGSALTMEGEGLSGQGSLLIKTGNLLFATLDSELNTDDGLDVFATIRGGEWNGAKVLGKVLIANNNVRIQFHTLAPQDDRPTMQINAIAMRPEDAKTGVAEDIDHHTFERYASLGAASILSGLGKAAAMVESTTIESGNGTIGYNTKEPDTEQIIGMALGEMGTAFADEIRKGFNTPTTYSTPAQRGLALYFVSDLYAPN